MAEIRIFLQGKQKPRSNFRRTNQEKLSQKQNNKSTEESLRGRRSSSEERKGKGKRISKTAKDEVQSKFHK